MAAKGGRHFEINIKIKHYEKLFISQKHAYTYTWQLQSLFIM